MKEGNEKKGVREGGEKRRQTSCDAVTLHMYNTTMETTTSHAMNRGAGEE